MSSPNRTALATARWTTAMLALALLFIMRPTPPSYGVCADATRIEINGKAVKADQPIKVTSREVVIKVYFESEATDYRICETEDFAGCEWRKVEGGSRPVITVKHTLSEGSGIKTIYFQAKRNATIAGVVKLQFELS